MKGIAMMAMQETLSGYDAVIAKVLEAEQDFMNIDASEADSRDQQAAIDAFMALSNAMLELKAIC